ncbi:Flp pilus assembly complex ATPase component TadA [Sulfurimonas sp. SAG-AH-194-I05]|nr:ATPase, T2SS/T4P/T4SS family [Sulfurimonas sp. SAG-AH-194-I05]MDF1874948.1 Flp pilus assembly complex ATPase component TadA [Sulfurimonas sp. SAG-AH-194-I05]
MNLKEHLTDKELEICQKEKLYYQAIGNVKDLSQIAKEHNFLQKKENTTTYSIDILKEYDILISKEDTQTFYIQTKEALGPKRLEKLKKRLGKNVVQKTIPVREFNEKFKQLVTVDAALIEKSIKKFNAYDADDTKVFELLKILLHFCVANNVSDIHINAYADFSWLRYRINGSITTKYLLSKELAQRFSLIIKEKSNIDLMNIQTPQSGSFSEGFSDGSVDFRVEIAPSSFGENIVLRILNSSSHLKTLEELFPKKHPLYDYVHSFVNQKNGFFLIVGPTGSGKTTTLNAIINQRDRLNEIIYTLEDPIEYKIDFITQYQINEAIGFDFTQAMKSVMRQDPDVIVIGEMRDEKSMKIALKAAHSGHMVYSTLHTTNAYMALERIRDEGGDLFILAYSLSGVIAQRLVLQLCTCKQKVANEKAQKYFKTQVQGYEKNGCIECNFTGYKERVLLVDMVFLPSDMKTRYTFYMALKNSTVLKAWDHLITCSYFESAQYLYENGICDYDTLVYELLSLGYVDED